MPADDRTDMVSRSKSLKRRPSGLGPGTILAERYELLELLGEGGMSRVYRARHLTLQDHKAVKILNKIGEYDEVSAQRFRAEAQILAKLKHPNIVEVIDADVWQEKHHFLVMELLDGESLAEWMGSVPLEERDEAFIKELLFILNQVCEGLETAHESHIVHRDLKPSNVMLQTDDDGDLVPKILDFGVAKRMNDDLKLTIDGDIFGTTGYMSPEQLMAKEPDERTDIFALGAILYEGLTGETPYSRKNRQEATSQVLDPKFKVVPPNKHNPNVTRRLNQACLKALERDPENRYQTVIDFQGKLVYDDSVRQPASTGRTRSEKATSKRRLRAVFGAALVAAVSAAAYFGFIAPETQTNDGQVASDTASVLPAKTVVRNTEPNQTDATAVSSPPPITPEMTPPTAKPELAPTPTQRLKTVPSKVSEEKSVNKQRPIVPPRAEGTPTPKETEPATPAENEPTDQQRIEELVREGNAALAAGRWKEAAKAFTGAKDIKRQTPQAWFGLSQVSFEEGDHDNAIKQIHTALRYQNRARWRIYLGQYLLKSGDKEGAKREWKRIAEEHPTDQVGRAAKDLLRSVGG